MTGQLVRLAAAGLVTLLAAEAPAGETGGGPALAAKPADTTEQPRIRTRAIRAHPVDDAEVGRPRGSLPGARHITVKQWGEMAETPASGLYIVGMRAVPRELAALLDENGLRLARDGGLTDRAGAPVALFVHARYYRLAKADGRTEATLPQIADARLGDDALLPEPAQYADRFGCIGVGAWLIYRGGQCKGYEARTFSFAYGACSRAARPALIDLIEARVRAGRRDDREACFSCATEGARLANINECFWPGRDGRGPRHSAYFGASGGMQRIIIDWYWPQR